MQHGALLVVQGKPSAESMVAGSILMGRAPSTNRGILPSVTFDLRAGEARVDTVSIDLLSREQQVEIRFVSRGPMPDDRYDGHLIYVSADSLEHERSGQRYLLVRAAIGPGDIGSETRRILQPGLANSPSALAPGRRCSICSPRLLKACRVPGARAEASC